MGRTSHLSLESIESCLKHNHDCLHTESHEFSLGSHYSWQRKHGRRRKRKKKIKWLKGRDASAESQLVQTCAYTAVEWTHGTEYILQPCLLQPFCCYSPWDRSLDVALCVCGVKMEILVYANLLNHFPVIVNFFCSPLFLHYNPIKRSLKLLIWWSVTNSLIRILRDWIAEPKGIIIFERPFLLLMRSSQ